MAGTGPALSRAGELAALPRRVRQPQREQPVPNARAGCAGRDVFRRRGVPIPTREAQATTNSEAIMKLGKAIALLALIGIGITSLGGCVVHEHRDGGVTVRPVH